MQTNNRLRDALERIASFPMPPPIELAQQTAVEMRDVAIAALAAPPHTGKWVNGSEYEYEYAYCSVCGHMQFADWDSHRQAEEGVISFADNYKFCPSCGAKMEGGVYVK